MHIFILLIVATLIFYDMYAGGVIYHIAARMRFGTPKGDLAWVLAVSALDAVLGILFDTAVMGLALQAKSILQKNSSRCHPGESRDP